MKYTFHAIVFVLFSSVAFAQIPAGYYDAAQGLSGEELKEALYQIIKGHDEFQYTDSDTDVWDILKETDKDPDNPNNVILLYTGWSVDAEQEWNSGSGWSREHVWSKSHGDFGISTGAGTDAHHLRPADPSVNSAKNNRWFDNCDEPYLDGGVETGCNTSSADWVWEPRDEVKGDVARMIFYMATRYNGEAGEPKLEILDSLPVDNNTAEPVYAKLSTLLQWHLADAVDAWEENRNNIIYNHFQRNRNPYIDHPEYVDKIWGPEAGIHEIEDLEINVYPNPSNESKTIHIKTKNDLIRTIDVYSVEGKQIGTELKRVSNYYSTVELPDSSQGYFVLKIDLGEQVLSRRIIVE